MTDAVDPGCQCNRNGAEADAPETEPKPLFPLIYIAGADAATSFAEGDFALQGRKEPPAPIVRIGDVGLWNWHVRSDLLQADPSVCDHFSVSPDRGEAGLPIASFIEGIHHEDRSRIVRRISYAVMSGKPFNETYRVTSRSRGLRWIQANGICFRDRQGRPETYPGTVFDVTEALHDRPHAFVIERLTEARHMADAARDPMLSRLIEAVLLEAGFRLAQGMKGDEDL